MERMLSIEEVCRKLKPIFGNKIDDIYLKYALAEKEEKEEIMQLLNALYNKNLGALLDYKVLLEPPSEKILKGDYELAMISYAGKKLFPFRLREEDWQRHVCISGMSGSGKTTLAFKILLNFIEKKKPFLVFDWKKSFRPLLLADPDMACFTIGNDSVSNLFKININQPPKGIDPREWINILCDLLVESFEVSFGVHKVLLETLDEAFRNWGVYEGSENYPTWEHIKWLLEEKMNQSKGRESGWIESALRIAIVLTFGNFGKVCNYKGENNLSVEDLLDRRVIFEMNSLGNVEKKFFCEFILTYVYKLNKAKEKSSATKLNNIILVDEAHNIFLKKPTSFAMESVTDMVYREMREYGTGLICIDQHISKLSDTIKGNSACHIAFQQQLPQDVVDISGLMQLKDSKHFFTMLPVGSAIVRLAERYTFPFLIEVEAAKISGIINDKKIRERTEFIVMQIGLEKGNDKQFLEELKSGGEVEIKPLKRDSTKSRFRSRLKKGERLDAVQKELVHFVEKQFDLGKSLTEIEELLEKKIEKKDFTVRDVGISINHVLDRRNEKNSKIYKIGSSVDNSLIEEQEALIKLLKKHPDKDFGTTEIYQKLGFTPRKGNEVKNKLLDKGLIRVDEIRSSRGWKKIIHLA